jgi:hypothetical protein
MAKEEEVLEEVTYTKFLGLHIDKGPTWTEHINILCNKTSSNLYVLR